MGPLQKIQRFFRELKRRNVYRVAVAYLVVAFMGLQAVDLLIPTTTLPGWADELLLAFLIVGFPIALVIAWAFEMTPEGVRRTPGAAPEEEEAPEPGAKTRTAYRLLLGLGLLAAAAAGGWYLTGGGGGSPEVPERSVAVLPFQVSGSAAEEWRDGMVTMLNTGLDGAAGLRAVADRTVFAAWEEAGSAGRGASSDAALSVARGTGARYAVLGSAVAMGNEIRLTADVHETRSGERLGRAEVRGSPDSITTLADSLTRHVLGVLLEGSGEGIPSVDLASLTTRSLRALRAFLDGEQHLRAGEYSEAMDDFEGAIRQDSSFALAHGRLALVHWWKRGGSEGEREAWTRAYELGDQLPRRERRLVRALYLYRVQGRGAAAADSLRELSEAYPDDPVVWYSLAEVLFHSFVPRHWPELDRALERAVRLDPGHALYYPHYVALSMFFYHDSARAAERIAGMPNPEWREAYRIALDLAFGSQRARQEALVRMDSLPVSAFIGTGVTVALHHPLDAEAHEKMLEKLRDRSPEPRSAAGLGWQLMGAHFRRGKIQEALALHRELELDDFIRSCYLAYWMSLGLPIPDTVDRSSLEDPDDSAGPQGPLLRCTGIFLIHEGRGNEVASVISRLREVAERAGADDGGPPGNLSSIDELRGYRAWRAGDPREALRRLSGPTGADSWLGTGDIWRGDLHRELGELKEAEGWYMSAWEHPLAHGRLGQIYEEMGEPEKAAAAYRRFVAAWEDADEVLQGRVGEARTRIQQLSATGGGADG